MSRPLKGGDSQDSVAGKPALKRQKLDTDDADVYDPNKNAHLKGRRRFVVDLNDIREACGSGLVLSGLTMKKVAPGEDEGSVEVHIADGLLEDVCTVMLLVTDTSEYPRSAMFGHTEDNVSSRLQDVINDLADEAPRPLGETIARFAAAVARVVAKSRKDDTESESGGSDGYDAFEDYDDVGAAPDSTYDLPTLQKDFVDIVATGYRPGFIRIGGNDFALSVSLPVIDLAESIPPRALMAWDRRLLSRSQHLTLLISGFHGVYPVLENDLSYKAFAQKLGVNLSFKVGLSQKYKPGTEQAQEVIRRHGLILKDAEDELRLQKEAEIAAHRQRMFEMDIDEDDEPMPEPDPVEEEAETDDPYRFDAFSLSSSLESLMDNTFLKLIQLRRKFHLGWAGAELLNTEVEKLQRKPEDIYAELHQACLDAIEVADKAERRFSSRTKSGMNSLPHDPLLNLPDDQPVNLLLAAFCYLIRRLSLCTRYCLVCHNKLKLDFEAIKPYVCDSKLCSYQYFSLNMGPSLEYEIRHNPKTVDLLLSLAYASAKENSMEEPFPIGIGLRVPIPPASLYSVPSVPVPGVLPGTPVAASTVPTYHPGPDGLCDFDQFDTPHMRTSIAQLLETLPPVEEMKKHLSRRVAAGKSKPTLRDIDPTVPAAAWSVLRWCVASCTAHIEAIETKEDLIKNIPPGYTQFRLAVGAPDAEAKFEQVLKEASMTDSNVAKYPVLYAFHGSPLKNWHSIIRHGLWYKIVAHGRAFGDGVYLAKEAMTSMGHYATHSRTVWPKSSIMPVSCAALTEVVNQPNKFVSKDPHYVIKDTHWIMCRYLLVKSSAEDAPGPLANAEQHTKVPSVLMDPCVKTTINGKVLEIPDPNYKIEVLIRDRKEDCTHEDADAEDMTIFEYDPSKVPVEEDPFDLDDDGDYVIAPTSSSSKPKGPAQKPKDDWKHNAEFVTSVVERLMLPPFESSPSASNAISRELKTMLKEQEMAPTLRDLGWYMPPELIGDNLYQWIVELHSFEKGLPLARDMAQKGVNSIIFEIRFPPTFPNTPPFFRIITPRFLPFIHGGGGHVTGGESRDLVIGISLMSDFFTGGSICMDLLTSDGWLPSYSISAVLMQIRLALSNLEPRSARLASNWDQPYNITEALAGYKRAAATHNWTLPVGLDRLVR